MMPLRREEGGKTFSVLVQFCSGSETFFYISLRTRLNGKMLHKRISYVRNGVFFSSQKVVHSLFLMKEATKLISLAANQ